MPVSVVLRSQRESSSVILDSWSSIQQPTTPRSALPLRKASLSSQRSRHSNNLPANVLEHDARGTRGQRELDLVADLVGNVRRLLALNAHATRRHEQRTTRQARAAHLGIGFELEAVRRVRQEWDQRGLRVRPVGVDGQTERLRVNRAPCLRTPMTKGSKLIAGCLPAQRITFVPDRCASFRGACRPA